MIYEITNVQVGHSIGHKITQGNTIETLLIK